MANPFSWLRMIRIVLGLLLLVSSLGSGRIGLTSINPTDVMDVLVTQINVLADQSSVGGLTEIEDGPLTEIEDESIVGTIGDPSGPRRGPNSHVRPERPGGVIGGGVSTGPDGVDETPNAVPTAVPSVPNTTSTPTQTPIEKPTPEMATATSAPSPVATRAPAPTAITAATATAVPETAFPRLDDPVLRFLPEVLSASVDTGVPSDILAGVIRVESNGDPNLVQVGRGRGLTGVTDAALQSQGVAQSLWHDPAENILAGAKQLASGYASTGTWDAALELYFGASCDLTGVCPSDYRYAVNAWATFYAASIANPSGGAYAVLSSAWTPPAVAPYQGSSPRPLLLPPGVVAPVPTPAPTATAAPTSTATPTVEPTATPTLVPIETPSPTLPPTSTALPIETPTAEPTP